MLDDHPIEECPFASNYFDIVVLINVLDHVMDAELCIKNAIRITKMGGILMIGQDLTDESDLRYEQVEDIGHPIKVNHQWLDEYVKDRFQPIVYKILSREEGRNPQAHYGTYIFAGKKYQNR